MTRRRKAGKLSSAVVGATLFELLAYMAVLGVAINLGAAAFMSTMRLNRYSSQALEKLLAFEGLRNDFVRTVRESYGPCVQLGNYRIGADTLVLELPSEPRQEVSRRYAVFAGVPETAKLGRLVIAEKDGVLAVETAKTYRCDLESVRFIYHGRPLESARLLTLEADLPGAGPPRRILASCRGIRP